MDDHRLKAFCLVFELRSFSKAAAAKLMSQSAMSHLIKNLEEELGVRLLTRQGKTVTPTSVGRLFYQHARRILDQYDSLENALNAASGLVRGPLRLGASATVASYLLPQVLYGFSREYPDVRIELTVSNEESIVGDVIEGRIEFGIVGVGVNNPVVALQEIAEDEIVIISSEDNPLAKKRMVTAADLESERFIMPDVGSGTREFADELFREAGIDPEKIQISMTLGSPELITQMVRAGAGVSFVSKWSVFGAMKEGSVRLLDLRGRKIRRKFHLIATEREPSTAAARAFGDFIRNYRFFVPF
ncbi:MAG: LysR substrate-binding domain-containing protein [Nitrospiraceae bacterium]|nr:LysR substrate-binding domain-containing protein [Nitrospiraceae bacterium]